MRWFRSGSGKSGGLRIIYYYHGNVMPIYLLTLFGKNEKCNLVKDEKQILAKPVKILIANWRNRNEQGI